MKKNSSLYILLVVGIVSALGPFVTDFYLPALPALTTYFGTTASMVQLTLTVSMVGLAIGQLFIGPLSDSFGRKVPLLTSLALFVIATAGCLESKTIGMFLTYRFIQGVAGSAGVVLSKSIATDLYEGKALSRFFSMLSGVQGLAPICAPVLGGLLLTMTDWHGIFYTLFLIGVVLVVALLFFKESLRTPQLSVWGTFRNYIPVVRNGRFMRYVLVQAMAMGVMFAYIAASPFIFQEHYGLSPFAFGLCFGVNALGIMAGSLLTIRFSKAEKALLFGGKGFLLMSFVVAAALIANLSVVYVEVAVWCLLFFLGLILPTSTTLSMELERTNSGSASAILGFSTFFVGGVCSPLAGIGNMLISTSVIIVLCAALTLLLIKYNASPCRPPVRGK